MSLRYLLALVNLPIAIVAAVAVGATASVIDPDPGVAGFNTATTTAAVMNAPTRLAIPPFAEPIHVVAVNLVDGVPDGNVALSTPILTTTSVSCPEVDLLDVLPQEATGTTIGAANQYSGSCGGDGEGPERTFRWTAPAAGLYQIDTFGSSFDTILYVLDMDCEGVEIACDDDTDSVQSSVTLPLLDGQAIVIVVDGYDDEGAFQLNIDLAPPDPSSTMTPGSTPLPTPTATPTSQTCVGDCNADGSVTVDEIIKGVSIALGDRLVDACTATDSDGNGLVTVDEIVRALNNGLRGCGTIP